MNDKYKYELPQKSPLEPVPTSREDLGVNPSLLEEVLSSIAAAAIIIRVKRVT